MDEPEEATQQNMVSNLPLLFANGYPTSLEKISEKALETFIPFMVQCSLGNMNIQGRNDISEPEWWPEDVPFSIPLVKPRKFDGSWHDKMKEIVVICYQFHKSVFLLRFCSDLAVYEPTRLRFMNNYNSTTSLYDRRCNKLLVTFRNENMSYDQPQTNRKTLLQKSRSQTNENNNNTQQMVEQALFDIYLCDNCDAELYSLEAITEHEKTCIQDDDVIICESPSPDEDDDRIAEQSATNILDKSNDERREEFLLNFALQSRNIPPPEKAPTLVSSHSSGSKTKEKLTTLSATSTPKSSPTTKDSVERFRIVSVPCRRSGRNVSNDTNTKNSSPPTEKMEKLKRLPRRNRAVYALSRCPTVPLSSPAGRLMIKSSKTLMTEDYLFERLDRMERFCHTPILSEGGVMRPKFMSRKYTLPHTPVTYKKPAGPPHVRVYSFPRRQFWNRYRAESFMFVNSLLLKQCRPITVRLRRLNEASYERRGNSFLMQYFGSCRGSIRSNSSVSSDCTSIRHFAIADVRSMHQPKSSSEIVLDTIDLCSSDDDESDSNKAENGSTTNETVVPMETCSSGSQAQIISSEVTLMRVSKCLDKDMEQIRKKGSFEGNFLVSQSCPTQPPTPLQPSVFLFSNYTTENFHSRHSTGSVNTVNATTTNTSYVANGCRQSGSPGQYVPPLQNHLKTTTNDNQENVERNSVNRTSSAVLKNSSFNTLQNGGTNDWLPNLNLSLSNTNHRTERSNSTTTTSNNNGNNNKLIQLYTCTSEESDVVLNKINSPNRTISIDLTI